MSELSGMTINERLFRVGVMDEFDAAILAGNQEEAISLLQKVELSREAAIETVAAIIKNPGRYGYTNR